MRIGQIGPIPAIAAGLCIFLLQALGAAAHEAPAAGPKTAPSAQAKPEVIGILGDSLGDGLWAGLYRILRRNRRFTVVKKSKVSSGLTQTTFFNWVDAAATIKKDGEFQIAVIFLGANDQQALKYDKKWYRFKSPEWTRIYKSRIAGLIKVLRKKKFRVYWVGLPVMQKERFDAGAIFLNRLYSQTAAKYGVPYIDIRKVTAGKKGEYATHYKDVRGKVRRMRADDGVHFTMSGYVVIAAHVFDRIQAERKKSKLHQKPLIGAASGHVSSHARELQPEQFAPSR